MTPGEYSRFRSSASKDCFGGEEGPARVRGAARNAGPTNPTDLSNPTSPGSSYPSRSPDSFRLPTPVPTPHPSPLPSLPPLVTYLTNDRFVAAVTVGFPLGLSVSLLSFA